MRNDEVTFSSRSNWLIKVTPIIWLLLAIMTLSWLGTTLSHRNLFLALTSAFPIVMTLVALWYVRRASEGSDTWSFTNTGVTVRRPTEELEVTWARITSVSLRRHHLPLRFPSELILHQPGVFGGGIRERPDDVEPLPTLERLLANILDHAPAHVVDPQVLLLGFARKTIAALATDVPSAVVRAAERLDCKAVLRAPHPADETVTDTLLRAACARFRGDEAAAARLADAVLAVDPDSWETLLCRALCRTDMRSRDEERNHLERLLAAGGGPYPEVIRARLGQLPD